MRAYPYLPSHQLDSLRTTAMKSINIMKSLAAALGGLLDVAPPSLKTRNRGKGRGRRLSQRNLYLRNSRPTDKRHWHDLNDPVQRDTLQAAEAKRQRKAVKLGRDTQSSLLGNDAHAENGHPQGGILRRLNPFYVNRGEVV